MKLVDLLKEKLSEEELRLVPRSHEIVGDICIIQLPPEFERKELIGKALLELHKRVKVVLNKKTPRKGVHRVREFEHIAGEKRTVTLHRESGCLFKVDVAEAYFSPREASERLRIAKQVKEGEKVLIAFGGIAPYAIVIAKHQPRVEKVVSIELNPIAHNYAIENIMLNKLWNKVEAIKGDVAQVCEEFEEEFDRIVVARGREMPAHLEALIPVLRRGGIIHLYGWGKEPEIFKEVEEELSSACERCKRGVRILFKKRLRCYAPEEWRVVIDAQLT